MKTLYLECNMGAAGDMLTASLLELFPNPGQMLAELNSLGIPGVHITAERAEKCGVCGTHLSVLIHGEEEHSHDVPAGLAAESGPEHHAHGHHDRGAEHTHAHLHNTPADIAAILSGLTLPAAVATDAKAVFEALAAAEAKVHGTAVEMIHFHEVGQADAVADIVCFCYLLHRLAPEAIIVSPIQVGNGFVKCAHGILPVPAPATAELLKGMPFLAGDMQGELCTPTGAAILKHFAGSFGSMPCMITEKIGYGMGKKDFPRANCVRAFIGQSTDAVTEKITTLECNLDDMTGEDISFAMEQLFAQGARDVFTVPIGMKKNRPAVLLKCVCMPEDAAKLSACIIRDTTTAGIRRIDSERYVLSRSSDSIDTIYGPVRVKTVYGMGVTRKKPEYEDLARIARENAMSLREVREEIQRRIEESYND